MKKVFEETVNQLSKGNPVVLATVVKTKGSTPQKTGAKLLVKSDGTGVGTLGGGCVEGDIWFAAKELLKSKGSSQYKDYELNEELAAEDGLICGGTMYFLIDPIYQGGKYLDYVKEIENAYSWGPPVALATIINKGSGTDIEIGNKLFIRENGSSEGSLGSAYLDKEAKNSALELMSFGNNGHYAFKDGSELYIESFTTPPQLVLCGGGHVSKSVARLAKTLGFKIIITDDRQEFANRERFPEAELLLVGKPEDCLSKVPVNTNTFIIIATRGHRHDNVALEAAAQTSAGYVGLLGSKRKTILIYEDLIQSGLTIDRIKQIRAPVGLDLQGRTPDEIAVSIMGEVLMVRYGGTAKPLQIEDWHIDRIHDKVQNSIN